MGMSSTEINKNIFWTPRAFPGSCVGVCFFFSISLRGSLSFSFSPVAFVVNSFVPLLFFLHHSFTGVNGTEKAKLMAMRCVCVSGNSFISGKGCNCLHGESYVGSGRQREDS